MNEPLYSVKMRASESGTHISGAERIVPFSVAPRTAAALVTRALNHSKGMPDFVNVKLERPASIVRVKSLPVATHETRTPEEGMAVAAELLAKDGITRIGEVMAKFADTYALRGAMLLDADTLERLDPDNGRGVRATCMDDADSVVKGVPAVKNHFAEAIVLATKVQNAPGIVAEICVSDDPDYTTGYVATRSIGYHRITNIKERGSPLGGRIFLYRGPRAGVEETIRFLERQAVLVEGVPALGGNREEDRFAGMARELEAVRAAGLWRVTREMEPCAGPSAVVGGREVVVLSSNDYLGLARDPRVKDAAAEAARRFGAGTGGARLTTGTQTLHARLEERLASFFGSDAAVAYATGYMANVGAISALVGKGDVVLSDELNHASIIDGCRLSGAEVVVYRHCDMDDLGGKLSRCGGCRRRLVVSDGVFSMDGDIAPLPSILDLCSRYDAFSFIDDAHAVGVVGATGRGTAEHFGCPRADITVGTLSKALGSEGGFVCTSRTIADYLVNRSRAFIFSTSPAPASVGAAMAALAILEKEPERIERLRANAARLVAELNRLGIAAKTQSAIVPVAVGDEASAVSIASRLLERGFLVPAIRYPTVARGKARLRIAVSAAHDAATLSAMAECLAAEFSTPAADKGE